jgi:anti-anti-sigma factor
MSGALALTLVHLNGTAAIKSEGEIDMATPPDVTRCLNMLTGMVVFDLAAVTFLDSIGPGVLIRTRNLLTTPKRRASLPGTRRGASARISQRDKPPHPRGATVRYKPESDSPSP